MMIYYWLFSGVVSALGLEGRAELGDRRDTWSVISFLLYMCLEKNIKSSSSVLSFHGILQT